MFMGAACGQAALLVDVPGGSLFDSALSPADASVTLALSSDGKVYDNGVEMHPWLINGPASNYEVRATLQSGDPLTIGTVDTWMSLSTTRSWGIAETGFGTLSSTLLIEVREQPSLSVLDSGVYSLQVIVDA